MDYKAVLTILNLADEIATTTSTVEFIKLRKEMQQKLEAMNDEYHDLECSYLELKAAEDTRKMIKKGIANGMYGCSINFDYHDDDPTDSRLDPADYKDLPFPDVEGGEE